LQLCAEDNMQVCNLTNAANYFHALRRQVRRRFRKPLVIVTPKSLLRAKEVMSPLADMGPGATFHRVIGEAETIAPDDEVRRVERVLAGLDVAAKRPRFVGRAEAASPATGLFKRHQHEQAQLVEDALAA